MKTFILFLFTVALALADGQTLSISDNLEVTIIDSKGNITNGGRLVDHIKMRPAEVQVVLNSKLATKATADPLNTRHMIDAAKAAGATVEAATEAKVKSAENDRDLLTDIGEVTVSCKLVNGVWTVTSPGKQTLILEENDPLIVNILNCAQFALNRDGRLLAWSVKNGKIGIILTEPEEIKKFVEWDAQTSTRINELYAALQSVE